MRFIQNDEGEIFKEDAHLFMSSNFREVIFLKLKRSYDKIGNSIEPFSGQQIPARFKDVLGVGHSRFEHYIK
jgi:hypothetical protein